MSDNDITESMLKQEVVQDSRINCNSCKFKYSTPYSPTFIFLTACFLWFSVSGNYYGLTIYLKHIPGDIYFNGIVVYTFEMFSYFFSGFIINTSLFGRRKTLLIYFLTATIGFGLLLLELSEAYVLFLFLMTQLSHVSLSGCLA
jgi:hypothetical protein